jgi:hypothetical protein
MSKYALIQWNNFIPDFNPIYMKTNLVIADSVVSNDVIGTSVQGNSISQVNNDTGESVDVATKNYVDDKIENLMGTDVLNSSLNTILEINSALNNDPQAFLHLSEDINDVLTFATNKTNQIDSSLNNIISTKAPLNNPTFTGTVNGISKSMIGLSNCDNTSDANKPVSTVQQTALNLKANQSSLDTTNANVSSLQSKTNAMSFNGTTNTLTMNEKVIVTLDESLNGNTTIGDASTDLLTVNASTAFNASVSGLTKSTVGLANVDNTSDVNKPVSSATQTALNLKSNDNTVVHLANSESISGVKNFTNGLTASAITLGAVDLNTRLTTDESNITSLLGKTNKMTYDGSNNALTLNEKIIITQDEFLQGNFTMGDASTDTMTVNATSNFVGPVNGLTKTTVGLSAVNNTSDLSKPISTATQSALDLKSNDNAVVHLTGAESVAGIKTFSSSPLVPDLSANDNSGKVANSKYVDTAISALVGSAPSTLNALNELASALGDDPNFATTMTNSLASKGGLSSNNTWSGVNTFPSSTVLNGSNLNTRLTTDETNISTNASNISTLQGKTSALAYDSGTNTLNISSKVSISKDVSEMGNIYLGDNSGNDIIYVQGNLNANAQTITPSQLGYLSTLTSNVQTQLGTKANLAGPTFTGTVSGITKSMVGLGNVDNTSDSSKPVSTAQQTALDLKANLAGPTFTGTVSGITKSMVGLGNVDNTADTSKPVSTAQQTALDLKANLVSPSFTGTPLSVTPSTSDNNTNIATTAFVKNQSYAPLASNNNFSGINSFTNYNYVNQIGEIVNSVTGVTTSCSLDFTTCKGVNYIQTPTANFSLALTNLPNPPSYCGIFTLSLMMAVKYYCNSITVNGTSRTMYFGGGSGNVSINGSASYVLQQINIQFLNSSTPIITSNVLSIW